MRYLSSIIITGSSQNLVDQKLKLILKSLDLPTTSNHVDIINFDHQTGWGIDQIRRLQTITQTRPIKANHRAIIIHQAQNLNIESQNSLLKTLEEPNPKNTIILLVNNLSSLADTIKSRCQIIKTDQIKSTPDKAFIVSQKISDNLNLSAQLSKDKQSCIDTVRNQIIFYQKQLLNQPRIDLRHKIKLLQKSLSMINANVNPTSALDFFFLSSMA